MLSVQIGNKVIDKSSPVFIVAEIGLNHNGSLEFAKKLIDIASFAGCDAVKFQKRNPEEAVPENYKNVLRETPWGLITYLEYRKKVEFNKKEYDEIDIYCQSKNIFWSASCWDMTSLQFMKSYKLPFLKIPSALMTHKTYLEEIKNLKNKKNIPIFLSTGMSDMNLVKKVVDFLGEKNLVVLHAVSTYPAQPEEINLNILNTFQKEFKCPIGYSGHEVGLQVTLAAITMGAKVVERHITLDRSLWGTDQAASLEPQGLLRLTRDIRIIEKSFGSSQKQILESERKVIEKLRKFNDFL